MRASDPITQTVSIIIPVLNDDAALRRLMADLTLFDACEIIIVDGSLRAAPPPLDGLEKLPVRWLRSEKGRGPQIDKGLNAAIGDYVWILHADSRPHPDSLNDIRKILGRADTAMGCFSLRFDKVNFWLGLFALIGRLDTAFTTFGDQGFFFRKSDYRKDKLKLSEYPLLEDWAIRQFFKQKGCIRKSKLPIETSARRFEKYGLVRTQIKNATLLMQYLRGVSPARLYQQYYTKPGPVRSYYTKRVRYSAKASIPANPDRPPAPNRHNRTL